MKTTCSNQRLDEIKEGWCPRPDLNRHGLLGPADFKSTTSTDFVTRAVLGRVGIVNYKRPHCQFQIIFLFIFMLMTSCAKYSTEPTSVAAKPSWFKIPERFESRNAYGEIPVHPFFDLVPFASLGDLEVNFVALTRVGEEFRLGLDLVSGRPYMQTPLCTRRDAWNSYGGNIKVANFTEGFIPRILDKKGTPQEILVFGHRRYLAPKEDYPRSSQRVRIVGGIVEQECERGSCKGNFGWSDRIILIGVNPLDPSFKDVNNLLGLKSVVDWEYTKAFLANRKGYNQVGTDFLAGFRIISEMGAEDAFKKAIAEGHYFKYEELDSLRLNCLKLYDYVWKSLLKVDEEQRKFISKRSLEDLKVRTRVGTVKKKSVFSDNVISAEKEDLAEAEAISEQGTQMRFEEFWKDIVTKNKDRLLTCYRWVRPSNLKHSTRRHWTLNYIRAYFIAEQTGHYYDCSRRAWLENPVRVDGTRTYNTDKLLRECTSADLDEAFDRAITLITGVYRSGLPSARYIGYDSGYGGTGQRLQTWVQDSGKRLSCVPRSYYERVSVFPDDLAWKELGWIKTWSRDDLIR